ncbi:MAG: peptide deformylase [Phycisphaerales bacterium]|nr:peptide deformylase [Phycisphaerales bacterium]
MSDTLSQLQIILYPDPRLRRKCEPVTDFSPELNALAGRMFDLMREAKGVGLAAPQVGVLLRMFVMNHTGEPGDDRVFVNPRFVDRDGWQEGEEGCLSIPDVRVQVRRAATVKLIAQDLAGVEYEYTSEELIARIWQHETDHLNGVLILDHMRPTDRIATKKTLKELEARYRGD